ncbi:MAG: hypothetical protein ACRD68_02465, partial [Pyrinomonadaceae bacterium]
MEARTGSRPKAKPRRASLSLVLFAALSACPASVLPAALARQPAQHSGLAQSPAPSDADARRKIEAALDALGGAARLRAITSLTVRTKGREHRSAEAQGYHPDKVTDAAHEETIVVYPSGDKLLYEHKTGRHDGTTRWRRWAYTGDERLVADFVEHFAAARRSE